MADARKERREGIEKKVFADGNNSGNAFFQADGKPVQNQLSTKKLDIDLQENGIWTQDADGKTVVANLMPGASVEKHVRVINDVQGDTSFYTRVRITRCWGEGSEEQFSKDFTLDPSLIDLDLNTTDQGGAGASQCLCRQSGADLCGSRWCADSPCGGCGAV